MGLNGHVQCIPKGRRKREPEEGDAYLEQQQAAIQFSYGEELTGDAWSRLLLRRRRALTPAGEEENELSPLLCVHVDSNLTTTELLLSLQLNALGFVRLPAFHPSHLVKKNS